MTDEVHQCECDICQGDEPHPDKEVHHQINLLMRFLDERQRRWVGALEARRHGWGGIVLACKITGLSRDAIRRGLSEMDEELAGQPEDRIRASGAGRPRIEQTQPGIREALKALVEPQTAGDPEGGQKWVRSSLQSLSEQLAGEGYRVSHEKVRQLLHEMDYSLRINAKTKAGAEDPQRDAQFEHIAKQRAAFEAAGDPAISVDGKKRN